MDSTKMLDAMQNSLGQQLPHILGAVAILILGWILAVCARAAVRRLLGMANLNRRVRETTNLGLDLESGVAIGAFWLILLITLVGVFNAVNLELLSAPFKAVVERVLAYLPNLLGGVVLTLVAWLLASLARGIATRVLAATSIDEKLLEGAGMSGVSGNLGNVLFWLVILLFIPPVLAAFKVEGLLEPFRSMVDKVLNMVPSLFAAAVIGLVGWLVARILADLVTNLLAAAGIDRWGAKAGMASKMTLSSVGGSVVFIFIFLPALIAALDAAQLTAISGPATDMLGMVMASIPNIVAAALILAITWFVARLVAGLIENFMSAAGFNTLPEKIGLGKAFSGRMHLSAVVAKLLVFSAMLFATVEAANRIGFTQLRDVVTTFIRFGGQVLLGSIILTVGFWLANLASDAIERVGEDSAGAARIARFAILGLVLAMGLRAMGIADSIVELAFGLVLGAIAVAVALSFGLGGREAAGRQMEHWLSRMRRDK